MLECAINPMCMAAVDIFAYINVHAEVCMCIYAHIYTHILYLFMCIYAYVSIALQDILHKPCETRGRSPHVPWQREVRTAGQSAVTESPVYGLVALGIGGASFAGGRRTRSR